MGYAFISYSSKNLAVADAVRNLLNRHGVETWMAPGDIPVGSKYAGVINRAVKECACFVLLLSNDSQVSEWVAQEVERAIHFKRSILPIQLEDLTLNDEFEFYIGNKHIIAIRKVDENLPEIRQLLTVVQTYTGSGEKPNPPQPEPPQNETPQLSASTATAGSLLKRAFLFLEDGEWAKADEYAERVLDTDPENGEAYLAKAMAELEIETRSKLSGAAGLAENRNVKKALRFGSDALQREINGYLDAARAAEEQRTAEEEKKRKAEEEQRKAELKQVVRVVEPTGQGQPQTVFFGHYPQTRTGEILPIKWLVLKREGTRALLISKYALDCQQYHDSLTGVTWETCSLRRWLNDTFLYWAFDATEEKRIQTATVTADMNPKFNTPPGKDTKDKVFLLSIKEASNYFSGNEERKCAPTYYAIAQGARIKINHSDGGKAAGRWWLRSPGFNSSQVACVDYSGSVLFNSVFATDEYNVVRPAMWVDLES